MSTSCLSYSPCFDTFYDITYKKYQYKKYGHFLHEEKISKNKKYRGQLLFRMALDCFANSCTLVVRQEAGRQNSRPKICFFLHILTFNLAFGRVSLLWISGGVTESTKTGLIGYRNALRKASFNYLKCCSSPIAETGITNFYKNFLPLTPSSKQVA